MAVAYPVVGSWYQRAGGNLFEVVAIDNDDATIEVQYFDGTIDEIEFEAWQQLLLKNVGPPEDWSGSVDMDTDNLVNPDAPRTSIGLSRPAGISRQELIFARFPSNLYWQSIKTVLDEYGGLLHLPQSSEFT